MSVERLGCTVVGILGLLVLILLVAAAMCVGGRATRWLRISCRIGLLTGAPALLRSALWPKLLRKR
jgi:hypothetical protein